MAQLDKPEEIKKIDPKDALGSVVAFPEQLAEAWQAAIQATSLPDMSRVQNIVLAGMGGSALGGHISQSLFEAYLQYPFRVVSDYQLPAFVNQNTLVVTVSYSGNTEETLSCFAETQQRGAQSFVITAGGQLKEKVEQGVPGFIFNPTNNPLGFPKTAIGYTLGGLLGFFSSAKIINLPQEELDSQLLEFKKIQKQFLPEVPTENNSAKKMATVMKDKIGVLIASQHLKGASWAFRNQINEIAHSFCAFFDLPEMNHHLVEALANPKAAKEKLIYLFMKSPHYHPRVSLRYRITQEVLEEQAIAYQEYQLESQGLLAQALEVIQLGGFASIYLSVLNNQDPGPELWIIKLKEKLSAHEPEK